MDKLVKLKYHAQCLHNELQTASDVLNIGFIAILINPLDQFLAALPIAQIDLQEAFQDDNVLSELTADLKRIQMGNSA